MVFTYILSQKGSGKSPVSLGGLRKLPNLIREVLIYYLDVVLLVKTHFEFTQKPFNCQKSCFSLKFWTGTAPVSHR